jgi:hypothetical protein
MVRGIALWLVFIAFALLCGRSILSESPSVPASRLSEARFDNFDATTGTLFVTDCIRTSASKTAVCGATTVRIAVNDKELKSQIASFAVGDHLELTTDGKPTPSLLGVAIKTNPSPNHPISLSNRLWLLLACAMFLLAVTALILAVASKKDSWNPLRLKWNPLSLVLGEDNRYSNSKCQAALWFWVLIAGYLYVGLLRYLYAGADFIGGMGIPQALLMLSGMSALTFAGAKGITTAKQDAATQAIAANPAASVATKRPNAGKPSLLADLLSNDNGQFDFGDFQMLVVTALAVGMYLAQLLHFTVIVEYRRGVTLPDVDTTILAAFGLGQGAYLAKKAAGNLGSS